MYGEGILTEQQLKCVPDVSFELIPIKNLVSNQDYQRMLSESHIKNALAEFDVYQINPVKVSRRDGVNYVFDGQHTIEIVAAESGSRDTPVWCMIYDDLKYTEEAHIFADQQKNVKKLTPYETFVAHIEAGDAKQMMIKTIVESYGLEISNTQKPNSITAITALERIYDKYGRDVLDGAIRLDVSTWEGEKNSFSRGMLTGLALIIVAYGDDINEDAFRDKVGQISVKQIMRTAKERSGGSRGFAETMMIAYNSKNKHRLSMRKLYGKKSAKYEPDEEGEDE